MKNYILRLISLLFVAVMLLYACLPLSALAFVSGTNGTSDAYRTSEYYKKLTSLSLTGDGRSDVVAVALSQLGYTEGNSNGDFSGTSNGTQNFTEYNYNMGSFGSGYGGSEYPWCASFVSFCLLQAGTHSQNKVSDWCRKHEGDANYIWREVSCSKWAEQLRTCGYFKNSASFGGDYLPLPGDLIFFTENGTKESHIGIVIYSDGARVYTVEGNTNAVAGLESNGGGVYAKSYAISSSYIRGYGVLPYKVNNSVRRIDYSGMNATAGTYIATIGKYIYLTENASTYSYLLPKYSLFTVTGVASNGRLNIICEIGGKTIEGYVKNNSDRVIQLTASEALSGYNALENTWGYLRSATNGYLVGENDLDSRPECAEIVFGDVLTLSGSVYLSREVSVLGYYFNSSSSQITWDDDAVVSRNGLDISYEIEANTAFVPAGTHELHFVLRLADGTVCEIDSILFHSRQKNQTVAQMPQIESITESSVTLKPTEGYEYKLGDGEWQPSNVFSNLVPAENAPLLFYQRKAQTDTVLAGHVSQPLTVNLFAIANANKLNSLIIGDVEILPEFSPDVTEYSVSVPYRISELNISAKAGDSANVTIDAPTLVAGETTPVKILVENSFGMVREYIINVARAEAPEGSDGEDTDVDENTGDDSEEETFDSFVSTDSLDDVMQDSNSENNSCSSSLSLGSLALIVTAALVGFKKKEE